MNAIVGGFEKGAVRVNGAKGPVVTQTYWGYTVSEGDKAQKRGQVFEIAGKFMGSILLLAAAGLWLLPNASQGSDIMVMKLGITVLFLMVGAVLVWSARKGFNDELQVDLVRKELRMGQRNMAGDCRLVAMLDFSEVGSVYLMRSKAKGEPARLYLRVGNSDRALEVAQGRADMLEPIKERLARDLAGGQDFTKRARHALSPLSEPKSLLVA